MCIDFHAINALQPTVVKANSKVKGKLILHPLPNTDQMDAQLKGARVLYYTQSQKWTLPHRDG